MKLKKNEWYGVEVDGWILNMFFPTFAKAKKSVGHEAKFVVVKFVKVRDAGR